MATRFAPSHTDADNSSGCLPAVRNDWHRVSRFHVGTGQCEPTSDAGYTTARVSQQPKLLISFLPLRGSPYMTASTPAPCSVARPAAMSACNAAPAAYSAATCARSVCLRAPSAPTAMAPPPDGTDPAAPAPDPCSSGTSIRTSGPTARTLLPCASCAAAGTSTASCAAINSHASARPQRDTHALATAGDGLT